MTNKSAQQFVKFQTV